jgi:hypothetical protein
MADGREDNGTPRAREAHGPRFSRTRFEATPEFAEFKEGMKKLLTVSKAKLDERVREHKANSPRIGDPKAPGRKRSQVPPD